jgi:hypothetical protein
MTTSAPPSVENTPAAPPLTPPPSVAVAPEEPSGKKKGKGARRIAAPPIATVAAAKTGAPSPLVPVPGQPSALVPPPKTTGSKSGTTLPHKGSKGDTRSTDNTAQPSGTGSPGELPTVANETTESAQPSTPAEQRAEAAARADADSVRFVVSQRFPQVHACYSRSFKDNSPGGRVDVGFVIGKTGRASKIRIEQNTTGSDALGKCLEQRVAEWEFPRPASGEFELIYPFVFSPGT